MGAMFFCLTIHRDCQIIRPVASWGPKEVVLGLYNQAQTRAFAGMQTSCRFLQLNYLNLIKE